MDLVAGGRVLERGLLPVWQFGPTADVGDQRVAPAAWLVIAVVTRDFLIVTAVILSWIMGQPCTIRPLAVSKANTVAQIVLAGTVLADEAFKLGLQPVRLVLIWTTASLTFASLASYLESWLRHMSEPAKPL